MRAYLDILRHILNNGVEREDRTGVGTIGVFGHQARFDLRDGFPLLTTKKMFFRGIVEELLWFISGDTNVSTLKNKGVHIWDAWEKPDGTIGPGYGKQFRRIVYSGWVTPFLFDPEPISDETPYSRDIVVDYSKQSTALLGKVFESEEHGPYTVTGELPGGSGGRTQFSIKFHRTGAERIAGYSPVVSGKVADLWSRTVFGVGRYGDYDEKDPHSPMLLDTWRDMLRRCYHEEASAFPSYGGAGVHVAPEWLTFANFQKDAKRLPNWFLKLDYPNEYSIDKDVRWASNRYSLRTCMWATHEEQSLNTSTGRPFEGTSPDGEVVLFRSFGDARRIHGLNQGAVHRCLAGKLHTHHGWSGFKYLDMPGQVLRTAVVDQLRSIISDIRHDPMSRRLVLTLWNPVELSEMALPPCHGLVVQFYVQGGRLSCAMYQRSCDSLIGLPFNIASYALLTCMIAQATGLAPGDFVHTFGDLHLYKNHLEQARLQLTREPRPLPRLLLNPDVRDLFRFRFEDVALDGYDPHPAIRAEVAV